MKHVFWAHMECGLVLSSVTPWELIPKTKGETRGGYMCKYCKGYWRAGGGGTRLLQIRAGKAILQLVLDKPPEGLYKGAAGVLPPGGALGPVAGRLHRGPEGPQVQIQPDHPDRPRLQCHLGADSAESGGCCAQAHRGHREGGHVLMRDNAIFRHTIQDRGHPEGGGTAAEGAGIPPREQRRPRLAPGEENWRGLG